MRQRNRRRSGLAVFALLAAMAPAQSALVIKTASERWANAVVDRFGFAGDLPQLDVGQHWKMLLDDGGQLIVRIDAGDVADLDVVARPQELIDLFSEDLAKGQAMARGTFALALARTGLRTGESVRLFNAITDFPRQVAVARLRMDSGLGEGQQGMQLAVELEPAPTTWLASVVESVKPGDRAPDLADPGAAVTLRVAAVLPEGTGPLTPLIYYIARIGARTSEERAERRDFLRRYGRALDGTAAMSWNLESGGLAMATGLRDPDAMRELYDDHEKIRWLTNPVGARAAFETEFEPAGLRHRDVVLYELVMIPDDSRSGGRPNPLFGERIVSYGGIAGSHLVGTMGADRPRVEALIDQALDDRFERSALGDQTLATLTLRLAQLVEAATGGALPTDGIPATVGVEIGNTGTSLTIGVTLR